MRKRDRKTERHRQREFCLSLFIVVCLLDGGGAGGGGWGSDGGSR